MHLTLSFVILVVVGGVIDHFFKLQLLLKANDFLLSNFKFNGWANFFAITGIFAVLLYWIAWVAMGPLIGYYKAVVEVGSLCTIVFMIGLGLPICGIGIDFSGRKAPPRVNTQGRPDIDILGPVTFWTAAWGFAILVLLITIHDLLH